MDGAHLNERGIPLDVLILAGGTLDDAWPPQPNGVTTRADLDFHGATIGQRVVEACAPLGRIVWVGNPNPLADHCVPSGNTFLESLRAGLSACAGEVLLVTADLPLLTEKSLRAFVGGGLVKHDLKYGVCARHACEKLAPGVARTYVSFREGDVTGGNVALMNQKAIQEVLPFVAGAYDHRKNPVALAKVLGSDVLKIALAAKLSPFKPSIHSAVDAVSKRLNLRVDLAISEHAEIATDVDRPEQLAALVALKKAP